MKKYTFFFVFLLFVAGTRYATAQGIIYVDSSRTSGANNGNDWANAYTSLQSALSAATPADTIWIARGTYYPSHNTSGTASSDNDATFHINKDSLQLYGGFAGTETSLSDRDIAANTTILSGDIGTPGDNSDNSYHVLYMNVTTSEDNISPATRIDGLTIQDGNADGSEPNYVGGGAFLSSSGSSSVCNPTFFHCTFSGNSAFNFGGAIYNIADSSGTSNPILNNCNFSANSSIGGAGAIYNIADNGGTSSAIITNCNFSGNSAFSSGGAIFNHSDGEGTSNPILTNCSFSGNSADAGGAIASFAVGSGTSNPILTNCSFAGNNSSADGGAIYNFSLFTTANMVIRNCIIVGNSSGIFNDIDGTATIYYSLIQEETATTNGNISSAGITATDIFADPVDPTSAPTSLGDYRLISTSPVIDMGSDSLYEIADGLDNNSLDNDTDLGGNPRLDGAGIDMGAFEFASPLPVSWQRFTASKEKDQVLLDWNTLTEQNNRGFTIEHSSNAAQWQPIAFAPSKAPNGNSTQSTRYSYRHQDPQNGPNYYRLRQEDIDGRYSYSAVRSVLFTGQSKLNLYPNPAGNYITIDGLAGNESIRITDITGSTLYQTKAQATQLRISLQQLAGGIYYIHLGEQNEAAYRFTVVK